MLNEAVGGAFGETLGDEVGMALGGEREGFWGSERVGGGQRRCEREEQGGGEVREAERRRERERRGGPVHGREGWADGMAGCGLAGCARRSAAETRGGRAVERSECGLKLRTTCRPGGAD